MASRASSSICAALRHAQPSRRTTQLLPVRRVLASPTASSLLGRPARLYSTTDDGAVPLPPPLMQKLKGDLKAAMRAKDAPRLAVLRAVMAANLNASKTSSPIRTDIQLVALIRKLQQAGRDAIAEAEAAGRADLVSKEQEQLAVLDGYVADSGVATLAAADMDAMVSRVVGAVTAEGIAGKAILTEVMKRLFAEVEGKDVDRKLLSSKAREAMRGSA